MDKIEKLKKALRTSWSLRSSTLWTADNPARGHCGVTSLVAQDILGGEILKTPCGDLWHFYNFIDGKAVDFTESQFDAPLEYEDVPSNRREAFGDTSQAQYDSLSAGVQRALRGET